MLDSIKYLNNKIKEYVKNNKENTILFLNLALVLLLLIPQIFLFVIGVIIGYNIMKFSKFIVNTYIS